MDSHIYLLLTFDVSTCHFPYIYLNKFFQFVLSVCQYLLSMMLPYNVYQCIPCVCFGEDRLWR